MPSDQSDSDCRARPGYYTDGLLVNVELIRDLVELGDRVRGMQATISAAFAKTAENDLESVRLDHAASALNPAYVAIEDAIDKIAAYEVRWRAMGRRS